MSRDNVFQNVGWDHFLDNQVSSEPKDEVFDPPYEYRLDPAESVPAPLRANCGVGGRWGSPPTDVIRRDAGLYCDVEYGEAGQERLLLDVHVPDDDALHPVAIVVHGGGWGSGDKAEVPYLTEPLTAAGFTWFSINYRLAHGIAGRHVMRM